MDRAKRTRKADKKIAYAEDSSEDPAWEDDAPTASGGGGGSKGKKRAKKTGKACGSDEPTHGALISRCSRGDLESLVLGKISDGSSTSISDILALLPEAAKSNKPPPAVVVKSGKERVGTGRFDALDEELLLAIIKKIPFRYRLACTTSVCKSWRSLRDHIPLWTEVIITDTVASFPGYQLTRLCYILCAHQDFFDFDIENLASIHIKYVYLHLGISHGWRAKGDEIGCSNKGMERLIKWMPDVDSVTKFDLSSSAAISPDAIKKVLANFSNLTSLSLRGKKVSNAVLKSFSSRAGGLKELILADRNDYFRGSDYPSQKEVQDLIKVAPLLEVLSLPCSLPFDGTLMAFKEARKGGYSLIRRLNISGGFGSGLSWSDMQKMGNHLPELEELKLNNIGGYYTFNDMASDVVLTTMPRLRTLHIDSAITFMGKHFTNDQLKTYIDRLLVACPVLEDLKLVHGAQHISNAERKNGKTMEPFPHPGGSLLNLPRTLTSLNLRDMVLLPEHFDELPLLASLTLINCGEEAQATKESLVSKSPHLVIGKCVVKALQYGPG
eukprot:CAMPEP_0179478516 /NCGR_PEP_ID=MMETSP0799-20121207/56992_1 /TAXON_ID=46947 /ORGANISM="Geminigera cryophila, Strain CCMP2564" /LENGTH=553 /DNA_ID=CAMNT_0021289697 /DNA_START=173 /DNA_END=1835 /DNA_ORIENTATION=+